MRDIITCAWRELTRRRGRTAANVFGYLLAVSTLVILVTLLLFARDAANAILKTTGTHFASYTPASCEVPCYIPKGRAIAEAFVGTGGVYTYPFEMTRFKQLKPFKYIKRVAPYILFRFLDANEHSTVTVGGFHPHDIELTGPIACNEGDLITKSEPGSRFLRDDDRGQVLVEKAYAEPRALVVGKKIRVAGKTFNVLGIVDTTQNTRAARADIYMTMEDLQGLITLRIPEHAGDYNVVAVEAISPKVLKQAYRELILSPLSTSTNSGSSCSKPAVQVLGMNERSVWLLALLVGIFTLVSSAKSQFATVLERRREIGILKAIGWTKGSVTAQIFTESVLQGAIGGGLGCLLAIIVLTMTPIAQLAHINTTLHILISPAVLLLGFTLAVAGGGLAGAIPAFAAASQRPAMAMRQV